MSRTTRLFDLIQALRSHRRAVTASALAEMLGVSRRTIQRDLDTLRALGAPVDGEAGVGYLLRPGFLLPPLILTGEEMEAMALGALWVRQHTDPELAGAATAALAKIAAVAPASLTLSIDIPSQLTATKKRGARDSSSPAAIRRAIREERKVALEYADFSGHASSRTIWPVALVYIDGTLLLAAWCELRESFRHFRTDRIEALSVLDETYPGGRSRLTQEWHEQDRDSGLNKS